MDLGAPIASADLDVLNDRLRAMLENRDGSHVLCDVGNLSARDAAVIDGLARLQLTAHRHGARVLLCNASEDLHALLELAGLCAVVGVCPESALEAEREAEEREPALGVEEERDPADPIA